MKKFTAVFKSLGEGARSLGLSLAILIILVLVAQLLSNGVFLRSNNLINLGRQNTMLLFVALAQLVVLLTGGIDLSVGAVVALSSVLVVLFQGYGIGLALAIALAAGAVVGFISGALVTFLKLPAFVITLAMQQIVYSVAKVMTNGAKVEHSLNGVVLSPALSQFYKTSLGGLVMPLWLCLAIIAVMILYMRTKYGYYLYAIGGNASAARFSGLPVRAVNVLAFALSSLLCAFAGFLFVCRVGTGDPDTGILLPMDAIAACTIGGVSLAGGKGSVVGATVGLLVLCVLNNVMSLVHVSPNVQPMVKGIVILITVFVNSMKKNGEN